MIKSAEEIQRMSVAGALTAKVLEALDEVVRPGISTAEIDRFCERYIVDTLAAIPGSKGQYGYPFTVNTSVNEVVCHGWPSAQQILRDGDIVNVDVTVIKDGYFGDSSKMYRVGAIDRQAQKLLDVTRNACTGRSAWCARTPPSAISGMPSRVTPKPTVIRWSANTAGMASAARCTRRRRSCTSVALARVRG